jgi:hypothetical protein
MEKAEAMSLPGGTPKEEQQDLQRRRANASFWSLLRNQSIIHRVPRLASDQLIGPWIYSMPVQSAPSGTRLLESGTSSISVYAPHGH